MAAPSAVATEAANSIVCLVYGKFASCGGVLSSVNLPVSENIA